MIPTPNTANRLALGLMAARGLSYSEAVQQLKRLTLHLVCDERVSQSAALQAGLLTALNCGVRAFLGGMRVELPAEVPLAICWPGHRTLNTVVAELLAERSVCDREATQTIYFGFNPSKPPKHALTVDATGWRGGVSPAAQENRFDASKDVNFAFGGIFAGALAVHRGFLRATALSLFACDEAAGLSLWDPKGNWLSVDSEGPLLRALPENLWLLGLGHLGQAFIWTLAFLPYAEPCKCEVMLQDYDRIEDANVGTGLLSNHSVIGQHKTRVCARWLEARGFRTKICERAFDATIRREPNEPLIALCGFDKAEPRRLLEGAGFARVIECGLGSSIHDFDLIHIHHFPGFRMANEVWKNAGGAVGKPNPKLIQSLTPDGERCGALAIETAGKAVSTSFVGAMASAAVFAELLRSFNRGPRYDELYFAPRNFSDCDFVPSSRSFRASEVAEWGYAEVKRND